MVVSEVPGTTRDAVDVVLRWHRRTFRIVDTAGIRRAGRVARSGQLESLSVMVARRAIERADVVVLLVDATVGATDQDAAIAGEADKAGCGVIIAANKWDLMKDRGPDFSKGFDETVRRQLKFLDWAPVMHISAASGERTPRLLEMIDRVAESRRKRVGTGELNRFVAEVTAEHPPASPGRRAGSHHVCCADGGGAADVRVLHQCRNDLPFLVRAVPAEPAARRVRIPWCADPDSRAPEGRPDEEGVSGYAVPMFELSSGADVNGPLERVLVARTGEI